MEPNTFWNIDSSGEAWSIVDLPVEAGVEYWCVLDCIRQAGFMLTKVDPFAVCVIIRNTKLNTKETTVGGRRNVNVDHRIAHFQIFQDRGSAIEEERLAVLVFGYFRLPFQLPA